MLGTERTFEEVDRKTGEKRKVTIRYNETRPAVPTRRFTNNRTGEIDTVPVGIDPGWHTNPGLARANTLAGRFEQELLKADPVDVSRTVTSWMKTPGPRALAEMAQKVRIPVAVQADLANALSARSPLIVLDNETGRTKRAAHKAPDGKPQIDASAIAAIPDFMASAEIYDMGQKNQLTLIGEIDGVLWRATVAVSANGYLRIVALDAANEDTRGNLISSAVRRLR